MDIAKLKYFKTIAETGSLREASEILLISSPALSKSMKSFEQEIGHKLFIPSGRNIKMTDKGLELYKKSLPILKSLNDLKNSLEEQEIKEIKIGTFEVFSTVFLDFIPELDWNEHHLKLYDMRPGVIEEELINRTIDIGITYVPHPQPELDFLKINQIKMGIYQLNNVFMKKKIQDLPFVIPLSPLKNQATRMDGLDGWPKDSFKRSIRYQVSMLESALNLCRLGLCAGYFPKFVVEKHNNYHLKKHHLIERKLSNFEKKSLVDVYIVKRKSDQENQYMKQIARAIRRLN